MGFPNEDSSNRLVDVGQMAQNQIYNATQINGVSRQWLGAELGYSPLIEPPMLKKIIALPSLKLPVKDLKHLSSWPDS